MLIIQVLFWYQICKKFNIYFAKTMPYASVESWLVSAGKQFYTPKWYHISGLGKQFCRGKSTINPGTLENVFRRVFIPQATKFVNNMLLKSWLILEYVSRYFIYKHLCSLQKRVQGSKLDKGSEHLEHWLSCFGFSYSRMFFICK